MKIAIALIAPALLIGGIADAQRLRALPYRALGTEPFWSLTIGVRTIEFQDAERRRVTAATPVPRPSFNGMQYVTPRIVVDVTRSRCSDGMSDRVYPDSVTVTIGQRTLRGCGGVPIVAAAPSPATAIGGRWRIERVDGRPVSAQRPAFVSFTGNRIGGNTGCNSFGGSFRFAGGFLTTSGVMSTRMACPGVMAQEEALLSALQERLSVTRNPAGKLVLSGRQGVRITLAR